MALTLTLTLTPTLYAADNNQYMVVDLNRFIPKIELQSGFVWLVEQIPGNISAMDITQILSYAYWPSFNIPYFEVRRLHRFKFEI
jgi:hypothetical protein